MADTPATTEQVEIKGRTFIIETVLAFGDTFYACGILPMRRSREALLRDIELSQGPEWRHTNPRMRRGVQIV